MEDQTDGFGGSSLAIKSESYSQMLKSLGEVLANVDNNHNPEDLSFFETATEALLSDYWSKVDAYKGRVFHNKLINKFKELSPDDSVARIKYLKLALEEAMNHQNSSLEASPMSQSSNEINFARGNDEVGSHFLDTANSSTTKFNSSVTSFNSYTSTDTNFNVKFPPRKLDHMFGLGDLVYSRNKGPDKTHESNKRLKFDDLSVFPRIGTDIFTNDLLMDIQPQSQPQPHKPSVSKLLNYPNFNPKVRKFNYDLSKNNMVSSVLPTSTNESSQVLGAPKPDDGQYPSSDVYEFVSALNTLKLGVNHDPKSASFHRTPEYILSLRESLEFLPAKPNSGNYFGETSSTFHRTDEEGHENGSALEDYEFKVFKCNDCHLSFKRNSDLKRHIKIHLTVLPHICNNCGKSFARKDALKRHYGTQTCQRNKQNKTYVDNLKFLTEEERNRDLSKTTRKKQPAEQ